MLWGIFLPRFTPLLLLNLHKNWTLMATFICTDLDQCTMEWKLIPLTIILPVVKLASKIHWSYTTNSQGHPINDHEQPGPKGCSIPSWTHYLRRKWCCSFQLGTIPSRNAVCAPQRMNLIVSTAIYPSWPKNKHSPCTVVIHWVCSLLVLKTQEWSSPTEWWYLIIRRKKISIKCMPWGLPCMAKWPQAVIVISDHKESFTARAYLTLLLRYLSFQYFDCTQCWSQVLKLLWPQWKSFCNFWPWWNEWSSGKSWSDQPISYRRRRS